ncbi:short-chain dehydrogenase [Streptomyces sp. AcH 505]|uniref:SDR family oxidoreductase n=1 Tax=Streptomyces sp. AcH 505 TaxID=352211 RepID=UPI000591D9C6|nr:short-chain dehydrogenase [Streptomyces sp. AcH 505]
MRALEGRVAVVTGAGRGIGREEALLLAAEGASVVVNDLGGAGDGQGADTGPAQRVVDEITAAGGAAVASTDDVADADGAQRLVDSAVEAFGGLDILVNNAGILRDRMLVNMSEEDWDSVMRVHLRGHFLSSRAAARYWRAEAKAGRQRQASLVNTTSTSGLFGNVGQANYGAAKSGIASFTSILQLELERYGVRCNAVAPAARTRLTMTVPGAAEQYEERAADGVFDEDDPANIAPFVAYLATADCPLAGRSFFVRGGSVHLFQPWAIVDSIETDHRWTIEELRKDAARFADVEFTLNKPY